MRRTKRRVVRRQKPASPHARIAGRVKGPRHRRRAVRGARATVRRAGRVARKQTRTATRRARVLTRRAGRVVRRRTARPHAKPASRRAGSHRGGTQAQSRPPGSPAQGVVALQFKFAVAEIAIKFWRQARVCRA
jgi:hypothetical protein